MSFPTYERYKESGVEWLGKVPEHWGHTKLKWLSRRYSGGTPDKNRLDYWENGTIPWLSSGEVNQILITSPTTYITEEAFASSSAKWVPDGALLVALAGQGKTKGMVAQLAFRSTCNQSMAALVLNEANQERFLFWWLTSNYQNIRNMAGGDLRDGLNLELLGDIDCPLIPVAERIAIAGFLDRETAKIDALIEEQRRLIVLLKEKRQAVISHAVTKGLNPSATMRDSGALWAGKIPAHWIMRPLKWRCSCNSGLALDSNIFEAEPGAGCEVPVVGGNGVMGYTNVANVDIPVVIVGRVGALCGNVHVIDQPAWITDNALVIRVGREEFSAEYLAAVLRCRNLNDMAAKNAQPLITGTQVKDQRIPQPPINEQLEIATRVRKLASSIDELTRAASTNIDLLQERRSALISAAVTGKIDVRNYKPAETAAREEVYEPA